MVRAQLTVMAFTLFSKALTYFSNDKITLKG